MVTHHQYVIYLLYSMFWYKNMVHYASPICHVYLLYVQNGRPFDRFDSKRQTLAGTGIPRRVSRVVYESLVGFFITTLSVIFDVVVVGVFVLVADEISAGFRVERHLQGEVGRVVDAVQSDDDAQDTDDRFDEEDENVSE